ncbi:MAG: hypothetical protein JST00_14910 [Deltaproteobacteria bacterium]|nr:hypothetical protein [Deltaproteobacteria bacterium]
MTRAQVVALVAMASIASVACTRKEDTATSETRTTSAESIPTVDLRSLPSAPGDNAGTNDTAGAPAAGAYDKRDGGNVTMDKKDGGAFASSDAEKKDGGYVGTGTGTGTKAAAPAGHGGATSEDVGPGHITTPALPRKGKQAPATGEPNSAGSHNLGQ